MKYPISRTFALKLLLLFWILTDYEIIVVAWVYVAYDCILYAKYLIPGAYT